MAKLSKNATLIETTEAATGSNRRYIANTLRGIRKDLMERYDLQWGRPSKEQEAAYDLKGYGYIYLPARQGSNCWRVDLLEKQ